MIRAAKARRLARTPALTGHFAPLSPASGRGQSEVRHDFSRMRVLAPLLQRWSYGMGAVPDPDYKTIPVDHKKHVGDALGLLERVATQPKVYPVCHKFFQDQCAGGTAATFADKVNNSVLWFDTDNTVWGSSHAPSILAYTDTTQRMGRWSIAGVFVHEMMHNCGQDDEKTNDTAILKCGFPDIQGFFDKKK